LNEWSSTPPVSSTMQAWKPPPAAALDVLVPPLAAGCAADEELDAAVLLPEELPPPLLGLLPQAASARASAATPTALADVRARGPITGTINTLRSAARGAEPASLFLRSVR
jgi:hypothetical protein